jgi:hypothetical protein
VSRLRPEGASTFAKASADTSACQGPTPKTTAQLLDVAARVATSKWAAVTLLNTADAQALAQIAVKACSTLNALARVTSHAHRESFALSAEGLLAFLSDNGFPTTTPEANDAKDQTQDQVDQPARAAGS